MNASQTDKLLAQLNAKNSLVYPDVGFFYFANIRGDNRSNNRSVYQIINAGGGVSYAHELNYVSARSRCDAIRRAIAA